MRLNDGDGFPRIQRAAAKLASTQPPQHLTARVPGSIHQGAQPLVPGTGWFGLG